MPTQSASVSRRYLLEPDIRTELPVTDLNVIHMGAAVSVASGKAHMLIAGEPFVGFAAGDAINFPYADGIPIGYSGPAVTILLRAKGEVMLDQIDGANGVSSIGATVYATDSTTFTLNASGTSKVGTIKDYAYGSYRVAFQSSLIPNP